MLSRARLHEALRVAAVARDATISHCKRLVNYEQDEQGVTARFDDDSTARGSLLIGADGIRSRVREILLPDGPKPQFTGLVGTGGFAPRSALKRAGLNDEGAMTLFFGAGAFVGCSFVNTGEEQGASWWSALARDQPLTHDERKRLSGAPGRAAIMQAGDGWNRMVGTLLDATTDMIAPLDIFDIASLPQWSHGRVGLIGDAAHAVSPHAGQGASLALEDAITLAKLLRGDGMLNPSGALAAFERERRERVERIIAFGRRSGDMKRRGVVATWLQNQAMRLFLRLRAPNFAWAHEHRIAW